jgi:hexosaminidase
MKNLTILLCLTGMVLYSCTDNQPAVIDIIPQPRSVESGYGYFKINDRTEILVFGDHEKFLGEIELFNSWLGTDIRVDYTDNPDRRDNVILISEVSDWADDIGRYKLEAGRFGVEILTGGPTGAFYAFQTIRQLLKQNSTEELRIPDVQIKDRPEFEWRGLMLDCSRTFLPIDYLKKQIDVLALYKMNTLHLHLTDDQGWRVEILKYPDLTAKCAEYADKYTNQTGGFYTQDELRELIKYAAARHITIVPEIEMPGHSSEIFAAYPELSCTGEKSEIFPFFSGPGITEDILCAGKEEVFEFLEDVIDEVIEIFPSEYIHVGGDEAPKTRWRECVHCQNRIKAEGLEDEHELQSYFISRMTEYIQSKGRKVIGWDEILEGGLAEGAAVMSWRGIKGGISAAELGHKVVMSPTSHCYIDYSHSTTSVEQIYLFNPIPDELDSDQEDLILGGQANMWTHIDRDPVSMDRQIWPRTIALAEVLWSDEDDRDWEDFNIRINSHYPILDSLGTWYYHDSLVYHPADEDDPINKIRLERYRFDFHGYTGVNFNHRGMACKIVAPEVPAEGYPWIWRARFWGHEPQLDLALLAQGYHVMYCDVANLYGNPEAVRRWNVFYSAMQHLGFSEKVILEGMSRGGLIIYNWATENPDKVSAIYADAPVLNCLSWPGGKKLKTEDWRLETLNGKGSEADWERFLKAYELKGRDFSKARTVSPISKAKEIAESGIPLIHVIGEADDVVPPAENTDLFENEILKYGGKIKVIRKPGVGHHPHSLEDPGPILEFLLESVRL